MVGFRGAKWQGLVASSVGLSGVGFDPHNSHQASKASRQLVPRLPTTCRRALDFGVVWGSTRALGFSTLGAGKFSPCVCSDSEV